MVVQFLFVDFVAGRIYARKRDQAFYRVNSFLEIEFRCIFVPYIDNILVASNEHTRQKKKKSHLDKDLCS